jgi:hypothetical protein
MQFPAIFQIGKIEDVTPNDSTDIKNGAIIFLDNDSTEGTIKFDCVNGGTTTLSFTKGELKPFQIKRVYATGTTASGIKAGYID